MVFSKNLIMFTIPIIGFHTFSSKHLLASRLLHTQFQLNKPTVDNETACVPHFRWVRNVKINWCLGWKLFNVGEHDIVIA